MIFTSCECGEDFTIDYECGDQMGYNRIDCHCGKIVMVERNSFGDTTILESEDDLEEFIKSKKLKLKS